MKGIDIFCASQASTAICLSMDQPSSSSSTTTIQLGGRAIDRHNPIITEGRRSTIIKSLPANVPCTSQPLPINPKPYHLLNNKSNKKTSSSKTDQNKKISAKPSAEDVTKKKKKSSSSKQLIINDDGAKENSIRPSDAISKKWAKPGAFITPPGSSRYLLSDTGFVDGFSDYDPVNNPSLFPVGNKNNQQDYSNNNVSTESKPSSSSSVSRESIAAIANPSLSSLSSRSERPSSDQVVVLRVSLHCKGCEGKVRKHLSRMEGVTSYNIDFAAKKVTIVGDVTPLGVLASVSKVKSAQFWPANMPPNSSTTPSLVSSNQVMKK